MSSLLLLERAWVGAGRSAQIRDNVLVDIVGGRFVSVVPDSADGSGQRVAGLSLPGFANAHSHAFHRALRGRAQHSRGTFWTWRELMYEAANRIDPDSYRRLAAAVFSEMVAAGFTTVGEFHYLHHRPDGGRYDDPNEMGIALMAAANDAGIRLCLLDACYLSGGFGEALSPAQVRFGDGSADRWRARMEDLREWVGADPMLAENVVVGSALHSLRAVPRSDLSTFCGLEGPVHAHVSEQPAENEECLAQYGATPVHILAQEGLLGPRFTAVHATHLSADDVRLLGDSASSVCLCPTTERDLADGIGPARRLADAGVALSIGSDSNAVIDPFDEMRAIEMDERLSSGIRGQFAAWELLSSGVAHGSLGFADAGAIAAGRRADLVVIDTGSSRTAGTGADEYSAVYSAAAPDVTTVMVDGRIVFDGDHRSVGAGLARVIEQVWQ